MLIYRDPTWACLFYPFSPFLGCAIIILILAIIIIIVVAITIVHLALCLGVDAYVTVIGIGIPNLLSPASSWHVHSRFAPRSPHVRAVCQYVQLNSSRRLPCCHPASNYRGPLTPPLRPLIVLSPPLASVATLLPATTPHKLLPVLLPSHLSHSSLAPRHPYSLVSSIIIYYTPSSPSLSHPRYTQAVRPWPLMSLSDPTTDTSPPTYAKDKTSQPDACPTSVSAGATHMNLTSTPAPSPSMVADAQGPSPPPTPCTTKHTSRAPFRLRLRLNTYATRRLALLIGILSAVALIAASPVPIGLLAARRSRTGEAGVFAPRSDGTAAGSSGGDGGGLILPLSTRPLRVHLEGRSMAVHLPVGPDPGLGYKDGDAGGTGESWLTSPNNDVLWSRRSSAQKSENEEEKGGGDQESTRGEGQVADVEHAQEPDDASPGSDGGSSSKRNEAGNVDKRGQRTLEGRVSPAFCMGADIERMGACPWLASHGIIWVTKSSYRRLDSYMPEPVPSQSPRLTTHIPSLRAWQDATLQPHPLRPLHPTRPPLPHLPIRPDRHRRPLRPLHPQTQTQMPTPTPTPNTSHHPPPPPPYRSSTTSPPPSCAQKWTLSVGNTPTPCDS